MVRKSFKVIAILVCIMVFTLSMAACGAAKTTADTASQAESKETKKEPVTLKLATYSVGADASAPFYKKIFEEFPKSKLGERIKLEIEEIPGVDAYSNKIKLLISSGDLPDVVQNTGANLIDLGVQAGKLADLTSYFDADQEWRSTFDPKSLEYNSRDGKIYGVPLGKELTFIYYNKELFQKASVEPPKTWDEFFAACDKLKAAGITPLAMDTADYAWLTSLFFGALIGTSGEEGLEFMNTKLTMDFNKPFIINAANKVQKMFKDYTTQDAIGGNYDVAANHFFKGEVAMIANGPWMVPDFKDTSKAIEGLYDKVGVMTFPGNAISNVPDLGEMVGAKEKPQRDAAVSYLKFLTSLDKQVMNLVMTGKVPTSPKLVFPEDLAAKDPLLVEAISVCNNAGTTFGENQAYWYPSVLDELNIVLPELAFEKITAEVFCQKLTEAAKKNK